MPNIHTINMPFSGWIQGEKFTDGKNIYILTEKWMKGFVEDRFVFINFDTDVRYEYTAQQFADAIINDKIYKI